MDIAPYHRAGPVTAKPTAAGNPGKVPVYHVRTECSIGAKIPDDKRVLGKGTRPKCAECTRLGHVGVLR